MKAGGKPSDRENRLWKARGLNEEGLAELREKEPKLFAKAKNEDGKGSAPAAVSTTSAKDLAKLECSVSALLSFLRPEVQLTARRAERRETQTIEERENEIRDETEGGLKDLAGAGGEVVEGADDSDEEEEIYNPKNLPLGWDGKPIAIWLYKLHGLNHYFECEICGGEKYRGSRAFERHFTEMNHNHGMKCLGIPNSTHFHGVTKIDDARKLWATIQAQQRGERRGFLWAGIGIIHVYFTFLRSHPLPLSLPSFPQSAEVVAGESMTMAVNSTRTRKGTCSPERSTRILLAKICYNEMKNCYRFCH